jgi:peptidoglycan-associated lipoprotein
MNRKWLIVLVAIAFAASFLTLTSCAKKQVKVEEAAKPAPVAKPAKPSEDKDREAKLRDLDAAERLRADIRAFESEHIYFDFDKYDLKPPAKAVLEKKAAWLRANTQYKVKIEGNCDERGTNEYNMALGERRAKAAMKYLNALGISADRMTTISYGEERPVCTEKNEKCWSRNRRDEFKLAK